jgi:hypothetical protein
MYRLKNNQKMLRNSANQILSNKNVNYGLNFNGSQELVFNNSFLTIANTYLQPNLPFSVSFSFYVTNAMFSGNGQGNFLWINNNSNYDGITTKGLNIASGDNTGIIYCNSANLTLGLRFIVVQIPISFINQVVNVTFTHDGNVFKSYFNGNLQQVGTSGTLTGTVDYTTEIVPGIRYDSPTFFQKGVIFYTKIYNRELNFEEVVQQSRYNSVESGLIYHLPFNSINGATTPELITGNSASLVNYSIGETPLRDILNNVVQNYTV